MGGVWDGGEGGRKEERTGRLLIFLGSFHRGQTHHLPYSELFLGHLSPNFFYSFSFISHFSEGNRHDCPMYACNFKYEGRKGRKEERKRERFDKPGRKINPLISVFQ